MPFSLFSSISLSISIDQSMDRGCPAWVTDHPVNHTLAQGKRSGYPAINCRAARRAMTMAKLHDGRTDLLEQKMPAFAQDAWRTRLVWQATRTQLPC